MGFKAIVIGVAASGILTIGTYLYLRNKATTIDVGWDEVDVVIHDLNETIVAVRDPDLLKRLQGHWKLESGGAPPILIPFELVITKSRLKTIRKPDTAVIPQFDTFYYGLYHDTDTGFYRILGTPDFGKPLINEDAFQVVYELRFSEDANKLEIRNYDIGEWDDENVGWWVYRRQ